MYLVFVSALLTARALDSDLHDGTRMPMKAFSRLAVLLFAKEGSFFVSSVYSAPSS